MDGQYRFLFGPVRSRRLGRSLGIDLVPFKVCTYDCPYCQVGATVTKTLMRGEYVPAAEVMAEFDHWLEHGGQADHVTLAGAGEPTLHSRFGEVLRHIGARCAVRKVLLSNGSLFHLKEVREAAVHADVVKGTLGAWDQSSFEAVHHPASELRFDDFLDGLRAMRAEFSGEYWLEVFLVAGVNDSDEAVARIARLAREIGPERIHLNTAVRPPQDAGVKPVPMERLVELARRFKPEAEAPTGTPPAAVQPEASPVVGNLEDRVLQSVRRHPGTAGEVASALGAGEAEVARALEALVDRKAVRIEWREGKPYMVGTG